MRARQIVPWAALAIAGCSALGLSDDLDRAPCASCAELDAIEPPPDCMSWQCTTPDDPMNGVCALDLIDRDGDDAPIMECATPERPADCDDDDPDNGPETAERCDLADNDCDGAIDEDALALSSSTLLDGALSALSFGGGEIDLVAAYRSDSELRVARLGLDADAQALSVGRASLLGEPLQTAVAPLGAASALAYTAGSGCSRVVLGVWDGSGDTLLTEGTHTADGLPKLGGACPSDTGEAGSPALAATSENQALVAFLAQRASRQCGDAPVEVGLVATRRTDGAFTSSSATATMAGTSTDAAPPALIAISRGFGYLLAFPDDDGIGVHRVEVDGGTLEMTVTELHREACSGACGDVSLAYAGDEIGLAYREGACGADALAALRILTLDASAATLSPRGPVRQGESASGLRRPVAARRAIPDEWTLAWTVTAGAVRRVQASRFDVEGMPVGLPMSLLETDGAFPEVVALRAAEGTSGLRAFTFDGARDALVRARASCDGT